MHIEESLSSRPRQRGDAHGVVGQQVEQELLRFDGRKQRSPPAMEIQAGQEKSSGQRYKRTAASASVRILEFDAKQIEGLSRALFFIIVDPIIITFMYRRKRS